MAPRARLGAVAMRKMRGFTLIELMIAVAIIGILAALAYPSYQNSVIKGNRASAKSFMMEVVQKETQILMDKRSYTAVANNAAFTTDLGTPVPAEVSRYYNLRVDLSAGPPPGFTVYATPIAGKQQAGDGELSITNTGVKTPADKW